MLDCHCHLVCEDFETDIDDVIEEAKKNNVVGCLVVPEFTSQFTKVLELAERHEGFIFPSLGLHPVQGEDKATERRSVNLQDLEEALPLIEAHADKLVAIGEVGLDFTPYYCREPGDKEAQRSVLTKFVELSNKYDLPLNVHSRSAGRPTIELLKANGASKVLMHAFDGNPKVALQGVSAGYYFSVPPSVVRSEQTQKLISKIPLENILLETDSPALGPEKMVRNVPSNIKISCEYVAQAKGLDFDTVAQITRENALKLFPKIRTLMGKLA